MEDKYKAAISFLHENLEEHFKKKDYSLIGTSTNIDSMGEEYKTYAFQHFDIPHLTSDRRFSGLQSSLVQITTSIENIISGLIQAKKVEKPEGGQIEDREVQVHWRSFPSIEINEGDFENSPKMAVFFRISLHHK